METFRNSEDGLGDPSTDRNHIKRLDEERKQGLTSAVLTKLHASFLICFFCVACANGIPTVATTAGLKNKSKRQLPLAACEPRNGPKPDLSDEFRWYSAGYA